MATRGDLTRERILGTAESLFLQRGYAGTSIDDILQMTGLTKGGFFYHFSNKPALGMAVLERYAKQDFDMFESLSAQADGETDDPLDSLLLFLELFESSLQSLDKPPMGCIFASYLYETDHFSDEVRRFIADGFEYWGDMYTRRIENVVSLYPPRVPVNAKELGQMIMCIIEGGLILSKSLQDISVTSNASKNFRQ